MITFNVTFSLIIELGILKTFLILMCSESSMLYFKFLNSEINFIYLISFFEMNLLLVFVFPIHANLKQILKIIIFIFFQTNGYHPLSKFRVADIRSN